MCGMICSDTLVKNLLLSMKAKGNEFWKSTSIWQSYLWSIVSSF